MAATPTPVTKPASPQEAHAHPVLLPDGRHFLYLRGLPPGKRTINLGDLDAAPDAQSTTPILTTDYGVAVAQASAGGSPLVLFLRDGTLLAQEFDMSAAGVDRDARHRRWSRSPASPNAAIGHFSVSNTGTLVYRSISGNNRQLTWFNRQGDIVGRPGEPAPYGTMKVSPDGSKAVVVQNDPRQPDNSDLWIVDLTSGASTRFTFDPAFDGQPVWSPDGRYVAWQSTRSRRCGHLSKGGRRIGRGRAAGARRRASPT